MKRMSVLIVTLVVALAATTAAAVGVVLANRDDNHHGYSHGPGMMVAGSDSTPGWWDDSWSSMMGSMMGAGVNPASEQEFLTEMVAHHRDAVTAAAELARSERPEMRALGEAIVRTQSAQIEQMTAWLADRYPDQPTADYEPMMRDLSGLSGDQLDRAFLEDMIGHHMVAVMMSQHLLFRGADHEEVVELARSIRDDQHAEIIQMQQWLSEWFGVDSFSHPGGGMGSGMMSR